MLRPGHVRTRMISHLHAFDMYKELFTLLDFNSTRIFSGIAPSWPRPNCCKFSVCRAFWRVRWSLSLVKFGELDEFQETRWISKNRMDLLISVKRTNWNLLEQLFFSQKPILPSSNHDIHRESIPTNRLDCENIVTIGQKKSSPIWIFPGGEEAKR